jgi:DNA-binding MarR family transcriptional regulator
MTGNAHDDPVAIARALVMVSRYSADITEIAEVTLGRGDIGNRDIEFLLAVHAKGSLTPKGLTALTDTSASVVSRALRRLEEAGLIVRTPDAGDRRSVLVTVTSKGRRRIAAFSARLADYFTEGEPLLKDMFHAVGLPTPEISPAAVVDPLVAAFRMGSAGAAFVEDVTHVLQPYGVSEFADRFTLILLFLQADQRPSQIARELGFSLSGASGLLARLETAGLINRQHDLTAADRRAVSLNLTQRGAEAAEVQLTTFARHLPDLADALSLTWRR